MAIYVFGKRMYDDIGALEEWGCVEWGKKSVVDEN
jgi:hypothetical protein